MMKNRKRRRIMHGSQLVSAVSVALVLVVLGVVALAGIVVRGVSDNIRTGMGVVVVIDEHATRPALDSLTAVLKGSPAVKRATYASAEAVNRRWMEQLGDDELPDVNPFQPEYDVKVRSGYGTPDSLERLATTLRELPAVYEVKVHTEMARNVNSTISTVMLVLTVVSAALLAVSAILIRNTVSMEIYAHRMVIHTMQYVGARNSFIRRPYVTRSVVSGIMAGLVASALLAGLLWWVSTVNAGIFAAIGWVKALAVFGGLVLTGALLCAVAAYSATGKYLRRSFDDIFD